MWYTKAALLLCKLGVYGLALCGVGALGTLIGIVTGKVTPEQVGEFAAMTQAFGNYILTASGSTVLGIISRFAVPAWSEYRRSSAVRFMQSIATQIRDQVLEELTSPKKS